MVGKVCQARRIGNVVAMARLLLGRRAAVGYPGERDDAPGSPNGRDRYLDLWRAAALFRVVAYHVFGWVWLTVLFPAMGLMFALAGSLMASSLDRSGPGAVGRRLRRLLPPLWAFGAVTVALLLVTGWRTPPPAALGWGELVWWIFPARTPPVGSQSWAWAYNVALWYIVTYLWLVLLSPALLGLFRRWPWPSLATAIALPIGFHLGVVQIGGYFNEQATNIATYAACWLLGFAHHDGLLQRIPARRYTCLVAAVAAIGAGWILFAGWSSGSFDINRIPGGNTVWSVAFVATVLRFRPRLHWLDRVRPLARTIELLNARAVTVYLWHLPAGMLAASLLTPVTLDSWTGNVILRLAGVWLLTAVAVALFGWIEDIAARRSPALVPQPARAASPKPRSGEPAPAGTGWHRGLVTIVAGLAVGLALTALNVWPGTPTHSQDRQPQQQTMRYLSDLLLVVDSDAVGGPTAQAPTVEAGTVTVNGEVYQRAVVAPANSRLRIHPPPRCARLLAVIGVEGAGRENVRLRFSVLADDIAVFDSGARTGADSGQDIDVNVAGANLVDLVSTSSPGGASAVWADARFACDP
jgi:peptidoglycan/LPS O-acetylase OafA/YrhL